MPLQAALTAAERRRISWMCILAGQMISLPFTATAADGLLDPSQIGSVRKMKESDGLLSLPGTNSTNNKTAVRPQRHSPSYARGMALSVVSSLNILTQEAAELMDALDKLDGEIRDLAEKLSKMRNDMAEEMSEYRQGLFCSGCGLTKRQILANGDEFPHPKQHIVKPTPEQIAAKERELQEPIDHKERDLQGLRGKRIDLANERDEALLQIGYGFNLWRTSISFEDVLRWLGDNERAAVNKAEVAQNEEQNRNYETQIYQLRMEMMTDTTGTSSAQNTAAIAGLNQKKSVLTTAHSKLTAQHTRDYGASMEALKNSFTIVDNELTMLWEYASRGQLLHGLVATPSSASVSVTSNFNELGGCYRMGSYRPADHDDILPSVRSFIVEFLKCDREKIRSSGNSNDLLPPSKPSTIDSLKGTMKELLNSAPGAGDKRPAQGKKSATGVRGRAYAPKPWKMCWVASVLKAGSRQQRLRLLRMEPLTGLLLSTLVDSSRISVRLCAAALSRTWQWSS